MNQAAGIVSVLLVLAVVYHLLMGIREMALRADQSDLAEEAGKK